MTAARLHPLRTARRAERATRADVGHLSAHRPRIDPEPEQELLLDGEPAARRRLGVECSRPNLQVILPRERERERARPGASDDGELEGLPEPAVEPERASRVRGGG